MSIQTIYARLVQSGLTPESACGIMGNFEAESAMRSNNVEDRIHRDLGMTDAQYTAAVDNGSYGNFANDRYGYGLYQLTLSSRKRGYLNFAKSRGVSIADEMTQVDYCVYELKTDFSSLWKWLCSNHGVYEAADRFCREFERPADPNVDVRAANANRYYMMLGGMDVSGIVTGDNSPTGEPEDAIFHTPAVNIYWPPRVLEYGLFGGDVVALQGLLVAHGYNLTVDGQFGNITRTAVMAFQAEAGMIGDGICGNDTWSALLKRG